MTLAAGMLGQWNIDQSRRARERQHPVAYLAQSYYENWLAGTEKLLLEAGLITAEELSAGASAAEGQPALRVPGPDAARKILAGGRTAVRESGMPPRFAAGDEVIVRRRHTAGHTRAPAYAQGCRGLVRDCHGAHIFPDSNAAGGPAAHHLYSVEFSSRELWGGDAEAFDVLVDLWEPYLALAGGNGQ